jgi:hypothetical protein
MASTAPAPAPRAPLPISIAGANKAFNDKVDSDGGVDVKILHKTHL